MDDNIDHNQSGLPVKDDEGENENNPRQLFDMENENQESGPIEVDDIPEPEQVADLIKQVPRMVCLHCLFTSITSYSYHHEVFV